MIKIHTNRFFEVRNEKKIILEFNFTYNGESDKILDFK